VKVEVTTRNLPGIGVCQELTLRGGHKIGVVSRRSGLRDLVIYDLEGEGAANTVSLSEEEANTIAELLGAPQLIFRLAELQRQADELVVAQLPVPTSSPFAGRPLGDAAVRTQTGASVVAVLRTGAAIPSPPPRFPLAPGDLVVTVGTQQAIDEAARILDGTSSGGGGPAESTSPGQTTGSIS
jgi:TrkA domain protein